MALMTLADMETEFWENIADADSANRAISSAVADRLLNRFYAIVRGLKDDRVYHVPSTTSGAYLAPYNTTRYKTLAETNYRRILEVYPAENSASTQPYGPALAPWLPEDIFRMQIEDPTDRQIYASAYAVWRAGAATAANVGKWNFALWPISSTQYDYILAVLKEVTALASGTDKADGTEAEHHLIVDMASAVGARLLGRSEEHINDIKARIPEELRASLALIESEYSIAPSRPGREAA